MRKEINICFHVFFYLRLAQRSFYAYKEPLNVAKTVLTCD